MSDNVMSLHDEMKEILRQAGRPLPVEEITRRLSFRTKKGAVPQAFQIAARASHHLDQFEIVIGLKGN